jgi:hypothetical protein
MKDLPEEGMYRPAFNRLYGGHGIIFALLEVVRSEFGHLTRFN